MKEFTCRADIVLATKVFFPVHDGPGVSGLSRKAIMEQIDAPLTRLGTDYIDLYQIHRFDPETPVEETMEALHDLVSVGKVRYLGATSSSARPDLGARTTVACLVTHPRTDHRITDRLGSASFGVRANWNAVIQPSFGRGSHLKIASHRRPSRTGIAKAEGPPSPRKHVGATTPRKSRAGFSSPAH